QSRDHGAVRQTQRGGGPHGHPGDARSGGGPARQTRAGADRRRGDARYHRLPQGFRGAPPTGAGRGRRNGGRRGRGFRGMGWRPFLLLSLVAGSVCAPTADALCRNIILPEQRSIDHRPPEAFPSVAIPLSVPPRTVSVPRPETAEWHLSLDETIRIALENARVIRVLTGVTAV